MTKKICWLLALLLVGCGNADFVSVDDAPPQAHTYTYLNRAWTLSLPQHWEILPTETQVLFMARNGDENMAILERDLTNSNPVQQIIESAENQFFNFELKFQNNNRWQFLGQPGPTNTPRLFWQQVYVLPESNKFLLATCSYHEDSHSDSSCEAILNSWQPVPTAQ